jgi:hypothetical protein
MNPITEADKAASPGLYFAIIITGLMIAVVILGKSMLKRIRNIDRKLDENPESN